MPHSENLHRVFASRSRGERGKRETPCELGLRLAARFFSPKEHTKAATGCPIPAGPLRGCCCGTLDAHGNCATHVPAEDDEWGLEPGEVLVPVVGERVDELRKAWDGWIPPSAPAPPSGVPQ